MHATWADVNLTRSTVTRMNTDTNDEHGDTNNSHSGLAEYMVHASNCCEIALYLPCVSPIRVVGAT